MMQRRAMPCRRNHRDASGASLVLLIAAAACCAYVLQGAAPTFVAPSSSSPRDVHVVSASRVHTVRPAPAGQRPSSTSAVAACALLVAASAFRIITAASQGPSLRAAFARCVMSNAPAALQSSVPAPLRGNPPCASKPPSVSAAPKLRAIELAAVFPPKGVSAAPLMASSAARSLSTQLVCDAMPSLASCPRGKAARRAGGARLSARRGSSRIRGRTERAARRVVGARLVAVEQPTVLQPVYDPSTLRAKIQLGLDIPACLRPARGREAKDTSYSKFLNVWKSVLITLVVMI